MVTVAGAGDQRAAGKVLGVAMRRQQMSVLAEGQDMPPVN